MLLQRQRPARRGMPSYLLVVMTLFGGLAVTQGAFWDNWTGNGKKVNDEATPAAPSEVVKPSVPSAQAGLDMNGVDVHSLITPAAVGHDISGGECGVYTRGLDGAELTLCVESVVEYGTDIKQINGLPVSYTHLTLPTICSV